MADMVFKTKIICPYCNTDLIKDLKIFHQKKHADILVCNGIERKVQYCGKDFVLEYTPCIMIQPRKILQEHTDEK